LTIAKNIIIMLSYFFFFQAEDGIRDPLVTGVQTCALPISPETLLDGQACTGLASVKSLLLNRVNIRWAGDVKRKLKGKSGEAGRSEERRVGKECRSRWWEEE